MTLFIAGELVFVTLLFLLVLSRYHIYPSINWDEVYTIIVAEIPAGVFLWYA